MSEPISFNSFLVRYDAARKAPAEAHAVDEFKLIHDAMVRAQAYARVAKDLEMIRWATEIRMLAVRGIGLGMEAQREAGMMATGGQPYQATGSKPDPVKGTENNITLEQAGIDKHLADKARKFAARTDDEFKILRVQIGPAR